MNLRAKVLYTWIRYADTSLGEGLSNNPTGKKYIGFAYSKTTPDESDDPGDYLFSLIRGEDGAPGETGFTWIRYSDYADGAGMYQQPAADTKYIGIAVNKPTETENYQKSVILYHCVLSKLIMNHNIRKVKAYSAY